MKSPVVWLVVIASTVSATALFTCPKSTGYFPFKSDCHAYWMCRNFVAFEMNCQPGLVFDPTYEMCVLGQYNSTSCTSLSGMYSIFDVLQNQTLFQFFKAGCSEVGINYPYGDIEMIGKIKSWQECGEKLQC